ncbi:hypothetical protein K469DRAFT_636651 [Zopfia rhizophila CBS 207.26]|uniref:Tat pathway signal sequence n=1 Tax=Zopfia rhizophila CBS 207.26 TaxID=1314779 RepID=A0A6A6DVX5_9PEZI|nr:hypothetical protein K469DRAFT_636651 [Zopfia rhizophila CBS 207.26]
MRLYFIMFSSKQYSALNTECVSEEDSIHSNFDASITESGEFLRTRVCWVRHGRLILAANLVILSISIILSFWSFHTTQKTGNLRNSVLREMNTYSPILDEIDLRLSTIRINGTDEDINHSIYRQPPSPELDDAWYRLSNSQTIWISSSDIKKMGKDPSKVAHFPEDFGLGPDAYAAEFDIYHKIHCLNTLRKEIHFDYYYRNQFPDGKPSEIHTTHVTHCLYILLQSLICDASTDIFTKEWMEGQIQPFPDFSINRKCGDFDAIGKWQEGRLVDNAKYSAWRMPEGHTPVPASDEFKKLLQYPGYREDESRLG